MKELPSFKGLGATIEQVQAAFDGKPLVPAAGSEIRFSRDEAAGLAIRVEDAAKIMTSILDGAEATTHPDDYKRRTLIIMARDRNRHLHWVASLLRGESQNSEISRGNPSAAS